MHTNPIVDRSPFLPLAWLVFGIVHVFVGGDSVAAQQPFCVTIDVGAVIEDRRTDVLAAVSEWDTSKQIDRHLIELLVSTPSFPIKRADGSWLPTGIATFIGANGRQRAVRFWRVDNDDRFDELLSIEVKHRGGAPELKGDGKNVIISGPAIDPVPGQKRRVSWNDLYLRDAGAVILLGESADVFTVDISAIEAVADQDGHRDWAWHYFPDAVPEELRCGLVLEALRLAAPGLQQFDREADSEYALRREFANVMLMLLSAAATDVESARFWKDWPRGDKRGTAGFVIEAREGSELAELISGLRGDSPQLKLAESDHDLATLRINMNVPEQFRALAVAIVSSLRDSAPTLKALFPNELLDGPIQLLAALSLDVNTEPKMFGAVPHAGARLLPVSPESLPRPLLSTHSAPAFAEETEVLHTHLEFDNQLVYLTLGRNPVSERMPRITYSDHVATTRQVPIAEMHVDFARWADHPPESAAKQLLGSAEDVYHRWQVSRMAGAHLDMMRRVGRPQKVTRFGDPVSKHLAKDGSWSLDATISAGDRVITGSASFGRKVAMAKAFKEFMAASHARELNRGP